jgi:hypothetical protein
MMKPPVSGEMVPSGVVHELPEDLRQALIANATALDAWKDITPLARNEFICWVEDAKRGAPESVAFGGPRLNPRSPIRPPVAPRSRSAARRSERDQCSAGARQRQRVRVVVGADRLSSSRGQAAAGGLGAEAAAAECDPAPCGD